MLAWLCTAVFFALAGEPEAAPAAPAGAWTAPSAARSGVYPAADLSGSEAEWLQAGTDFDGLQPVPAGPSLAAARPAAEPPRRRMVYDRVLMMWRPERLPDPPPAPVYPDREEADEQRRYFRLAGMGSTGLAAIAWDQTVGDEGWWGLGLAVLVIALVLLTLI